jgi:CheY-like chemotaxis protein
VETLIAADGTRPTDPIARLEFKSQDKLMARARVLLADDNSSILRILQSILQGLGCDVSTASDGADALLKVRDSNPDLVLADFSMPIMDGIQLFRKLQEYPSHRDVPFVLLATREEFEQKIRPLSLVPDEIIEKPFFAADARQRLKTILSRMQQHRLESMSVEDGAIGGRLADMGPVDLIQVLEIGRKTGALSLARQGETAVLYFREGQIYDAESGDLRGDLAVFRILNWGDGDFKIQFGAESKQHSVQNSTQGLLMEGMRQLDEGKL